MRLVFCRLFHSLVSTVRLNFFKVPIEFDSAARKFDIAEAYPGS